jgi:hypothetical protein
MGWSAVEPLERFAIELPRDVLARALGHLQDRAELLVGARLDEPRESLQVAQRALQVLGACRAALSQLADERVGERS